MSCPVPKRRSPVEVLIYIVHPWGMLLEAGSLAENLDAEARAHEVTREALVEAQAELTRLRPVVDTSSRVLDVTDTPTTIKHQDEHLSRLALALSELRNLLSGTCLPEPSTGREWAELQESAAPFLQIARDRLARRSWEPVAVTRLIGFSRL